MTSSRHRRESIPTIYVGRRRQEKPAVALLFAETSNKCSECTTTRLFTGVQCAVQYAIAPNRFRTVLHVLWLKRLHVNFLISQPSSGLFTGLRINERIECKLFSLTYKVLTTSQTDYLHNLNLCSVYTQNPLLIQTVTLARPSSVSSLLPTAVLKYATQPTLHLWNQLPSSFRQPHPVHSALVHLILHTSPHHIHSPHLRSHNLLPHTPSASRLKTHLFYKSFPHGLSGSIWTALTDLGLGPKWILAFFCFSFFFFTYILFCFCLRVLD